MGVISENTPITLGAVVVLIGLVFWLSKIYSQGKENRERQAEHIAQSEKDSARIWLEIEAIKRDSTVVIDRMARIETKLDAVHDLLKKSS